ncbi:MAG: DUF3883 domain-containing protein [Clostridia bacterium]|jgi:hypothetical protein|nr:DUF3883 domain-containing protein [Clostridia bacterium]
MKIYDELINRKSNGSKLNIEQLTKEDFYFMYIEEGKTDYEIAQLYDVTENKIEKLRKKWNIKVTQEFISDIETMNKIYEIFGRGYKFDYSSIILKEHLGIPKFDDLFLPTLEILKDGQVHSIKEFWKLTERQEYEISKKELEYCVSKKEPMLFYRADLCINALIQAELIESVDIKEYKINKRGQGFIKEYKEKNIEKISLGLLEEKKNIKTEALEEKSIEEVKTKQKVEISIQAKNLKEIQAKPKEKKSKTISKNKRKKTEIKYSELDAIKKAFGDKCEEIVYNYEKNKLKQEGRTNVDEDVIWVSKVLGDGEGYDIKSKEKINGKYEDIYIEVKGTDKNCNEPFEISINEVEKSEEFKERYYIYRLGKGNSSIPEFYKIKGSIKEKFKLEPVKFKATIKGEDDEKI